MSETTYINVSGVTVDAKNVTVPSDRTFRGAWDLDGPVIKVDMVRARDIKRDQLRAERAEVFQSLDAEYFLALEQGDQAKMAEIAGKKQKLRDVTKHTKISSAKTPETLAALTLEQLTV